MVGFGPKMLSFYFENSKKIVGNDMMQSLSDGTAKTIFSLMASFDDAKSKRFHMQISFWAVLVWFKFVLMFQYTRTFGPVIKIIQVMTVTLLKFMVIWWLVIVCFVCTGMLLFPFTNAFSNLQNAVYFMLNASIGNWDTSIFEIEN